MGVGIRETGDPVSKRGGVAIGLETAAVIANLSGTGAASIDAARRTLAACPQELDVTFVVSSSRRGSVVDNGNNSFLAVVTERGRAAFFAAGDIPVDCADGDRGRTMGPGCFPGRCC